MSRKISFSTDLKHDGEKIVLYYQAHFQIEFLYRYKTMYNNTLMPERFMCMFAINPNTPKNQKIVKVPMFVF